MSIESTPCLVIGAGPAGISAVQWLESLHVPYRWISRDGRVGGFLHSVYNTITNYPGGVWNNGAELAGDMEAALEPNGVGPPEEGDVRRLRRVDDDFWQADVLGKSEPIIASTVLLATGTRYKRLGIPGEREGLERGYVSQSGTRDAHRVEGRRVAVVGGGDSGFENAIHLSEHGCHVSMLLRNDEFKARPAFVAQVTEDPNIEYFPFPTRITAVTDTADGCRLSLDVRGEFDALEVACLFVKIGVEAVMPEIQPELDTDGGFVVVDEHQLTSQPVFFAAGDVTKCPLRAITSAVGSAASATKAIADTLDFARGPAPSSRARS